jgi:hypothetical protein
MLFPQYYLLNIASPRGGSRAYRFGEVQVWPMAEFVKALYAGEVF